MKICEFIVRAKKLYHQRPRVCNIIFSIIIGCAIGLTTALLLPSKKDLILKQQLVDNLNCLKIKGQTVIVEKRHNGLSYAVFEFPVEAKLSVSLSGLKKQNGNILILPQPFVSTARIDHSKKALQAYQYNRWMDTANEMEHAASLKAQSEIEEIANGEDMKSRARKYAEKLIPKYFFPEKDITIQWEAQQ